LNEELSYFRKRIPTTENLATTLWDLIGQGLPEGSSLARIRLHEDEDLYVEYFGGA
ncbi:MAG: 6-carboxytetrahydropterin synthase, partial [Chloroflexi bacterium]|nr:6-carboxytetrahydropterin synthase [Chloroflexota bacterium]